MLNSPLDSIFFCDFICLILKPCKSLSFKALCGAAFCGLSTDCGRGTIGFDLDQTMLSHVFVRLKGSNLFKHPLYRIHSFIPDHSSQPLLCFSTCTASQSPSSFVQNHSNHCATNWEPWCYPSVSFFIPFPKAPHTCSYDHCWTLNLHFHRIMTSTSS